MLLQDLFLLKRNGWGRGIALKFSFIFSYSTVLGLLGDIIG